MACKLCELDCVFWGRPSAGWPCAGGSGCCRRNDGNASRYAADARQNQTGCRPLKRALGFIGPPTALTRTANTNDALRARSVAKGRGFGSETNIPTQAAKDSRLNGAPNQEILRF